MNAHPRLTGPQVKLLADGLLAAFTGFGASSRSAQIQGSSAVLETWSTCGK